MKINKKNLVKRIIVSPFVLCMLLTTYLYACILRWLSFLRWGGEFINYEKDTPVTMQSIFDELKNKNKL